MSQQGKGPLAWGQSRGFDLGDFGLMFYRSLFNIEIDGRAQLFESLHC
jgi:hypothetical protein